MQRPLKWRAEQTETGWVPCLSKVLIKPHSEHHWNQTKQTGAAQRHTKKSGVAHFLSSSSSPGCVHSERCKVTCVRIWFTTPKKAVFLSEVCTKRNYCVNCTVVENHHCAHCHPATETGGQGGLEVKKRPFFSSKPGCESCAEVSLSKSLIPCHLGDGRCQYNIHARGGKRSVMQLDNLWEAAE